MHHSYAMTYQGHYDAHDSCTIYYFKDDGFNNHNFPFNRILARRTCYLQTTYVVNYTLIVL